VWDKDAEGGGAYPLFGPGRERVAEATNVVVLVLVLALLVVNRVSMWAY